MIKLYRHNMCVIVGLLFSLVSGQVFSAESEKSISIKDAVSIALSNNPYLESRRAKYNALTQVPSQASALPEPRLILNAANLPIDSFSLSQTPMTQLQLGLVQDIPFPGKLILKERIAKQESLISQQAITITSQLLVKNVKLNWWQIFYLDRYLETIANNLKLLTEFIEVAETKYTVGQGLQQDVLLAHVELAKLEDTQSKVKALRKSAEISFNTLLGRRADTTVFVDRKNNKTLPETGKLSLLISEANKNRSEVASSKLKIAAARDRVALAEKDFYPDFKLGAVYGWRQDQTALASVQLSMNLPFNIEKRQKRKKDQRSHELLQQKYILEDTKNQVAEEVHKTLVDYERSRSQAEIFQNRIIPQAAQVVDAMLAGYQVNKVDFLQLLQAQVNLFNFRTQYWQAYSSANQALASIDYAIGSEVSK